MSLGKSVVFAVVDRFSKLAHFVPLSKLPSALLMTHMFLLHGTRIESDRVPQFVSNVGKCFCQALSAMVSLSSDYYPQTKGQTEHVTQDLGCVHLHQ